MATFNSAKFFFNEKSRRGRERKEKEEANVEARGTNPFFFFPRAKKKRKNLS
jgi:hypothetical protein